MLHAMREQTDLAHAQTFELGGLRVEPARRLVLNGNTSKIIEPRVMQLLVALHSARGQVLSRDDLMRLCWGGVVVGENAVQRTISQARKIAATIGEGSFEIETVRGVGYRLLDAGRGPADAGLGARDPDDGALSRRSTLALIGAGAVAAAAVPASLLLSSRSGASRSAKAMYERAEVALRDEAYPSGDQAISLLKDAVAESPRFPDAWGALAIAYWGSLFGAENEQADHWAGLANSAAKRALDLEPGLASARTALVMVNRDFHNPRATRAQLSAIARDRPDHWIVPRAQAMVDADLGDWGAAIRRLEQALRNQPILPQVQVNLARAYWAAGDVMAAEDVLLKAGRQWRRHYGVWEFQFRYLALTGQYEKAAAHLEDEARLPLGLQVGAIEKRKMLLEALRGSGERDSVIQSYEDEFQSYPLNAARVVPLFAALGADREMFTTLEGYFFGRGKLAVKQSRYARRPTMFLFLPPMRKYVRDPRFVAIKRGIGLA